MIIILKKYYCQTWKPVSKRNDNKIYLIDKHEKKELEIDIYKKTVNEINNRIYYRGWQNTTINKLLYQNSLFYGTNPREYIINDNYLYEENENYKKRLTSEKIETIARKYSDSVYYFINNKLYYYDDNQGNVLLIENFEWIFNKDNVIFAIQQHQNKYIGIKYHQEVIKCIKIIK